MHQSQAHQCHIFTMQEFFTHFQICQNKILGKGHDSIVYLFFNKNTKQQYALKCSNYQDEMHLTNFKNEIAILKLIAHPNIIKLYGHSQDESCILLEHMTNGSLANIVSDGFPENIAKTIAWQILDALRYLHDKRIIHSDLKPENILIAKDLTLKLCDFGFSTVFQNKFGTLRGGSEGFIAPEMYQYVQYEVEKCDIFAFGVIIFILITGLRPFLNTKKQMNDDLWNLLSQQKFELFWSLIQKNISKEFKALFQQLMCIDPKSRPSLEEIVQSPWFKSSTRATNDQVKQELAVRLNMLNLIQQQQQQILLTQIT